MGCRDHGSAASNFTYELKISRHHEYDKSPPTSDDGMTIREASSLPVLSLVSTDLILTFCISAKWFGIVLASTITHSRKHSPRSDFDRRSKLSAAGVRWDILHSSLARKFHLCVFWASQERQQIRVLT